MSSLAAAGEPVKPNANSPNLITACLMIMPNALMWRSYNRGGLDRLVAGILRSPAGVGGLFVLPFTWLTMEKSFYDSAMAIQGIDCTNSATAANHGGYPSGGHMLPSLSIFPVKHVFDYFK
mmetsp:Transcript_22918/g.71404  ORF Transcript_22918/g.71404 Transcript_22918/m.71404 type:complete len:121 (+) Transcript_22918:135-497(+)